MVGMPIQERTLNSAICHTIMAPPPFAIPCAAELVSRDIPLTGYGQGTNLECSLATQRRGTKGIDKLAGGGANLGIADASRRGLVLAQPTGGMEPLTSTRTGRTSVPRDTSPIPRTGSRSRSTTVQRCRSYGGTA